MDHHLPVGNTISVDCPRFLNVTLHVGHVHRFGPKVGGQASLSFAASKDANFQVNTDTGTFSP